MLAGVIVYFIFILGMLSLDMVLIGLAKSKNLPLVKADLLRYLRGLEMLGGVFMITIMALAVSAVDLVTIGFVRNITIILGIIAVAYVAEFTHKEVKLRDYHMVLLRVKKSNLDGMESHGAVKYNMQEAYVLKTSFSELIEGLNGVETTRKSLKKQFVTRLGMAIFILIALIASIVLLTMEAGGGL